MELFPNIKEKKLKLKRWNDYKLLWMNTQKVVFSNTYKKDQ